MYKYIDSTGVIHSTLESGDDILIKDQLMRESIEPIFKWREIFGEQ